MDRERLHADLRRAPPERRRYRGATRSAPGLRGRHRVVHGGFRHGGAGPEHRDPRVRASPPGRRRGHDHAPVPHPLEPSRAAGAESRRTRGMGSHRRPRRGHRTLGRRRCHDGLVVAVHLLAECADRDRSGALGPLEAEGVTRRWHLVRPPGRAVGESRSFRHGVRPRAGQRTRLDQYQCAVVVRDRHCRPGDVRVVGTTHAGAHAAPAALQATRLRRRQRDGDALQLRDVRRHLLPVAVPPDRAGLFAARARDSGSCPGRV